MRSSRVVKQEAVILWLGGWLSPRRKLLSCPERRPSFPNSHAPVPGDVCASRTRTRSNLCRLRYFDRRKRVSLYGLRGSGFPSP